MKLLKIEDNKGHYLNEAGEFDTIDKISKEGLMKLVNLTLNDEIEFDEYKKDDVKNEAHQIIYKNIFEKLRDLRDRKKEFADESQTLFLPDYQKYKENS